MHEHRQADQKTLLKSKKRMDSKFYSLLEQNYSKYTEKTLSHRRFKHNDVKKLIKSLSSNDSYEVKELGRSVENREIYHIRFGHGTTTVLLWSQMHGNEPTATQALFDLFHFFDSDDFAEEKAKILAQLTIHVIPMLNPDGAERYQRRNALGVDPNRDAQQLQAPETQLLKKLRDRIQADFGFNLHDQTAYYTAGNTPHPATISFLAPASDIAKTITPTRKDAMQLIAQLNDLLQQFIPNHVAKYDDTFSPRSFGDNMQAWGTRTILVESGAYPNDPERQLTRKMNFLLLVAAFQSIAKKDYKNYSTDQYFAIPDNQKEKLFDKLIRNVTVEYQGYSYQTDIGINLHEIDSPDHKTFTLQSEVMDIGDLSMYYGYEEIDATEMKLVGKLELGKEADFKLK